MRPLKTKLLLQSCFLALTLSHAYKPAAQAGEFQLLDALNQNNDIRGVIIEQLELRDLRSLNQTAKSFQNLGKLTLQSLRQDTRRSVTLTDASLLLVEEAIADQKIPLIHRFNSAEALTYFLEKAPRRRFKELWREESFLAAQERREPSYLPHLQELKEEKISSLISSKWKDHLSTQKLTKMAYSLLFSMFGYECTARGTIWYATTAAAWNASRDPTFNDPKLPTWTVQRTDVWEADRNAARDNFLAAARKAVRMTFMKFDISPAWNTALQAILDELQVHKLTGSEENKPFAQHVAEKVCGLYFFQHLQSFSEKSFQAAYKKMPEVSDEENIFLSQERWHNFQEKHFQSLSLDQKQSLAPWLKQLDHLVLAIQNVRPFSA